MQNMTVAQLITALEQFPKESNVTIARAVPGENNGAIAIWDGDGPALIIGVVEVPS